jgi:hypothetical protein
LIVKSAFTSSTLSGPDPEALFVRTPILRKVHKRVFSNNLNSESRLFLFKTFLQYPSNFLSNFLFNQIIIHLFRFFFSVIPDFLFLKMFIFLLVNTKSTLVLFITLPSIFFQYQLNLPFLFFTLIIIPIIQSSNFIILSIIYLPVVLIVLHNIFNFVYIQ